MFHHFAAPAPRSKGHQAACAGGWRRISERLEHAGFRVIFLHQARYAAGDDFRRATLPQELDGWSPWPAEARIGHRELDLALAIIADLNGVLEAAPEVAARAKRTILTGAACRTFSAIARLRKRRLHEKLHRPT